MNSIYRLFQDNLDVVFFIYGLAFIVMGITIFVQPRKGSRLKIAGILWLLAGFGLTHGTNEWLDMWAIIKGKNITLDLVRWFCLIISYLFLFEFGRCLFRLGITGLENTARKDKIAKTLGIWLSPVILIFILSAGFASSDIWSTGSTLTRYFLGFPGSMLTAFGFFFYYKSEKKTLEIITEPLKVKKHFQLASVSFFIYGILGGLIVPKGDFFPSNWLNTEVFFSIVKIPVQVFRAICAILSAYSITRILSIFDCEMRATLQISHEKLELLVGERTAELRALNEQLRQETVERCEAEVALRKYLKELENFHRLAVGRETKMIELKNELEQIKEKLRKYTGEKT